MNTKIFICYDHKLCIYIADEVKDASYISVIVMIGEAGRI